MRIFILIFFCLFTSVSVKAQEIWYPESFIQTQGRLSKDGAIGLCSWAFVNAGYSGYMINRTSGQEKKFHEMNLIWSGIDLAIGIPTFIRSHRIYKGKIKLHLDTYNPKRYMKIYSVNSWLDLTYIAAGFIIKSKANSSRDPEMMHGYGNAILMQGGLLFSFDSVMYLLHRKLLKNHLHNQLRYSK
jgi:hypothetical protein